MLRYLVLMLVICSSSALAETVFIQDLIFVPLRGGPSEEYRIIHRGIPSGTELELVRNEEDSNFSLVRLKDGTEGWRQLSRSACWWSRAAAALWSVSPRTSSPLSS